MVHGQNADSRRPARNSPKWCDASAVFGCDIDDAVRIDNDAAGERPPATPIPIAVGMAYRCSGVGHAPHGGKRYRADLIGWDHLDGQAKLDRRALQRSRGDPDIGADQAGAFANAEQAKPCRCLTLLRLESDPGVGDRQVQGPGAFDKTDAYLAAPAVLGDIGQTLLRNAIERHRHFPRRWSKRHIACEMDGDVSLIGKLSTQAAERRTEADIDHR